MEHLLPLERCVLAMRDRGLDPAEIGRRIRRSPEHVERIFQWSQIPRSHPARHRYPRALENRVLGWLDDGESPEEVAKRFKRSPRSIRQIAGLAHYRIGADLLRSAAAEARAQA